MNSGSDFGNLRKRRVAVRLSVGQSFGVGVCSPCPWRTVADRAVADDCEEGETACALQAIWQLLAYVPNLGNFLSVVVSKGR